MINLSSATIHNGHFDLCVGKFGTQKLQDVPNRSPHVRWDHVPQGTESLALVMLDHDAVPVVGFSWIHWLVADIDPRCDELPENASQTDSSLIQGTNSLASKQVCGELSEELTHYYSGPRPPDRDHEYEIRVYALDTTLHLKPGFRLNELLRAMRGHVLEEGILRAIYPVHS